MAGSQGGDEERASAENERAGEARQVRAAVDRLPLRRQLGLTLVSSFDGTNVPAYMRRRLRAGETAGVILFGPNVPTAAAMRRVTRGVQRAADGQALIAIDQEGGDIRNAPWIGPATGQPLQGDAAAVRREALAAARRLRAAGVNVNLAPVADVPVGPTSAMAGRAFAGTTAEVAAKVRASIEGMRAGGVAATAKHFPGLGAATANTDDTSVTIDLLDGELGERDLPPFRAAIAADVPLVMLGHALYPILDENEIASQSQTIATDLLREELGFRGVTVTDSLEAQAVLDRSGIGEAAERSLEAGADLILMTGSGSWNEVFPRLLARAQRDRAFRARVREAAARVLRLQHGLRSAR